MSTNPDVQYAVEGLAWLGGDGLGWLVGVWESMSGRGRTAVLVGAGCLGWSSSAAAGGHRRQGSGLQSQQPDPFERGHELGGPGPVGGEAQVNPQGGVGDEPGSVQEAVAQPLGFCPGRGRRRGAAAETSTTGHGR
jgi:hypothetical protein